MALNMQHLAMSCHIQQAWLVQVSFLPASDSHVKRFWVENRVQQKAADSDRCVSRWWFDITRVEVVPSGKRTWLAGKSHVHIGNTSSKGPFSIAMLVYRRVIVDDVFVFYVLKMFFVCPQNLWNDPTTGLSQGFPPFDPLFFSFAWGNWQNVRRSSWRLALGIPHSISVVIVCKGIPSRKCQNNSRLHSLKVTKHPKIGLPKRKHIFQPSIFRCYVSFREGRISSHSGYPSII